MSLQKFIFSLGVKGAEPSGGITAPIKFGFATDLHHADRANNSGGYFYGMPPLHYRDTIDKLTDAISRFNTDGVDFTVLNGDLTDGAHSSINRAKQKASMVELNTKLNTLNAPFKLLMGNHDTDKCTSQDN